MTNRERMCAVLRGEKTDRVVFCQYSNNAGSDDEIWTALGKENVPVICWTSPLRIHNPKCILENKESIDQGMRVVTTKMRTPAGDLEQVRQFEPVLNSGATRSHYIESEKDFVPFLSYLKGIHIEDDLDNFRKAKKYVGDNGVLFVAAPRTPYQAMWVEWSSMETLSMELADGNAILLECMDELQRIQLEIAPRLAEFCAKEDLPMVDVPDNITAPMIGSERYRRWCQPVYRKLAGILHSSGVKLSVHMDGDLRSLWKDIRESDVDIIDSLSPAPANDTSVADALREFPNTTLLVNFPSQVFIRSEKEIYDYAVQLLSESGHSGRVWIQVSENPPPGTWRKTFPLILKAINEFGKP
ncbi:MAG: hypothetical protein WAX69_01080 [Victivallales bacterium]